MSNVKRFSPIEPIPGRDEVDFTQASYDELVDMWWVAWKAGHDELAADLLQLLNKRAAGHPPVVHEIPHTFARFLAVLGLWNQGKNGGGGER